MPLDEKTAIEFENRKREFMTTVITPEVIEKMIEDKVTHTLKRELMLGKSIFTNDSDSQK